MPHARGFDIHQVSSVHIGTSKQGIEKCIQFGYIIWYSNIYVCVCVCVCSNVGCNKNVT